MPTVKSTLLVGATGAVGRHVLSILLGNKSFTSVSEYGRRTTAMADLAPQDPPNKLIQKTVDFEKIEAEGLKDGNFDVVVIT